MRLNAPPPQATLPGLEAPSALGASPANELRDSPQAQSPGGEAVAALAWRAGRRRDAAPARRAAPRRRRRIRSATRRSPSSSAAAIATTWNACSRCPSGAGSGASARAAACSARARGTLAHKLLESVDFARPRAVAEEDVARAARALWHACRRAGAGRDRRARERPVRRRAPGAGARPGRPGCASPRPLSVRREYPFAFSLGPDEPLLARRDRSARRGGRRGRARARLQDRPGRGGRGPRSAGGSRVRRAAAALRAGRAARRGAAGGDRPLVPASSAATGSARATSASSKLSSKRRCAGVIAAAWRFEVSAHPRRALCETCPGRGTLCSYEEAATLAE